MVEDLRACGRALAGKGLVWGRSGNISAKVESNVFLVSASGADLGALREEDLVPCRIDSDTWQGPKPPSIEREMHQAIYQVAQSASAVIHSQALYTTLVACADLSLRTDLFPEAMAYLGRIERVPYHHAGSHGLAFATADKASRSRVLLLNNHGSVCWGSSLQEALLATETLEFLCRLTILAQASNIGLCYLGQETALSFLEHLKDIKGV